MRCPRSDTEDVERPPHARRHSGMMHCPACGAWVRCRRWIIEAHDVPDPGKGANRAPYPWER